MRIVLNAGAAPRLERAADFARFSIALDPALDRDRSAAVTPIGELADADHAWVRPDAVRALSLHSSRPEWEAGFAAMIGVAATRGWTDTQGRIRAHIERAEAHKPVNADVFRRALRRFASGVCIVAAGEAEARCGMTVSAFSSVSAEPPMVLVCLSRKAMSHACVTGAATYSINILRAAQVEEAMLFAGQRGLQGSARFGPHWISDAHGAPILSTALHSLVCTSVAQHDAGTHTILIGRVIAAIAGDEGPALVNFEGTMERVGTAA